MNTAAEKLRKIQALVIGVGRTGRPNDGMDMLADAVQRILDEPEHTSPGIAQLALR